MAVDAGQVTIDRATPADAAAIMTIKRDAWLGAYVSDENGITAADIKKKMSDQILAEGIANWEKGLATEQANPGRATYVARLDGKVVGYTSPCLEDEQRRIGALYVAPEAQGMGIGSKLLRTALDWHGSDDKVYLHVVSYNQAAIRFYEHNGFHKTGKTFDQDYDERQGIKLLPELEMVHERNGDTPATYIDKLAYIHLKDGKVLSTLSKGKDTWYIPGGKRETGESDQQALMREVKEELTVSLRPETIRHYGTFEAPAHGKPAGTVVRMTCYQAEFDGELQASSEIADIAFVGYDWKAKSSAVDGLIFDDLKKKGLLH